MSYNLDFWPSATAVLYFIGIGGYYMHIEIVLYLQGYLDGMNKRKAVVHSLAWPMYTLIGIGMLIAEGFDLYSSDDDGEDN